MCSSGEGGGGAWRWRLENFHMQTLFSYVAHAANNFLGVSVFPQTLVLHYLSHNNMVQQHFRREARLTADYNGI